MKKEPEPATLSCLRGLVPKRNTVQLALADASLDKIQKQEQFRFPTRFPPPAPSLVVKWPVQLLLGCEAIVAAAAKLSMAAQRSMVQALRLRCAIGLATLLCKPGSAKLKDP